MGHRFNKELADQALELATPGVEAILAIAQRQDFCLLLGLRVSDRNGVVLAKKVWGNGEEYFPIASRKFVITAREGISTREAQLVYPEMAGEEDDTIYYGSWITRKVMSSGSGVEPYFDEACSMHAVGCARALLTQKREAEVATGKAFRHEMTG